MKWTFSISLGLREETIDSDTAQVRAALDVSWFDGLYIKVPHSADVDAWLWNHETWLAVVEMLKASRKTVVFGRNLWPSWARPSFDRSDLLSTDYYRAALEQLPFDANLLSYHLSRPVGTLLDLEPYGNHPFNRDEQFKYGLSQQVKRAVRAAIKMATIDSTATDTLAALHLAEAANCAEQIALAPDGDNAEASKVLAQAFAHVKGMPPARHVPLADHCWPCDSSHPGHYSYQLRGLGKRGLSYKTYHHTKAADVWRPSQPDPYPDRDVWMCYLYPTEDARGERSGKLRYAMTVDRFYAMEWERDVMEMGSDPTGVWRGLREVNIHGHGAEFRVAACVEFKQRGQPELSPGT